MNLTRLLIIQLLIGLAVVSLVVVANRQQSIASVNSLLAVYPKAMCENGRIIAGSSETWHVSVNAANSTLSCPAWIVQYLTQEESSANSQAVFWSNVVEALLLGFISEILITIAYLEVLDK